jgi:hypothetical protein
VFIFDLRKGNVIETEELSVRQNSELYAKKRWFFSVRLSWHSSGRAEENRELVAKFYAFTAEQFRYPLSWVFARCGLFVADVPRQRIGIFNVLGHLKP